MNLIDGRIIAKFAINVVQKKTKKKTTGPRFDKK